MSSPSQSSSAASPPNISIDKDSERGYARDPQLQQEFAQAAEHLRRVDGYVDPADPQQDPELRADLALEGGGVKGIGLAGAVLVLDEAGYAFPRVAGTSAGAIAASLIAAIGKAGEPISSLRGYLNTLDFTKFMPEGKIHHFLDHFGGPVQRSADAEILTRQVGLYPGTYLADWLQPILASLGVVTFGDLRIDPSDDPHMSLPPERRYRLVVHTSDITREQLVRLPWDYNYYGLPRDQQQVVGAVRASMSIPFFFEPVTTQAQDADVEVPMPDGSYVSQHYDAGAVTWVDGGMLENFPINAFDRIDGGPPRWPTIGVKLSVLQTQFAATQACDTALSVGIRVLHTMTGEWNRYSIDQTTAARTIFVDRAGLTATQFDLPPAQQDQLFLNGVTAATRFIIEMARAGGVPRNAQQAQQLVKAKMNGADGSAAPATQPE